MRALIALLVIAFFSVSTRAEILECSADDIFNRVLKVDLEKNEFFVRFAGADPNEPYAWQAVYFGDRFCAMKFDNPQSIFCPFTKTDTENTRSIDLKCTQINSQSELDLPAFGELNLNLDTMAGNFRCGAQGGTRFNLKLSKCKFK
ncbi:MAG: hypothetical protein AB7O96_16915 [Pseudobdellovibrionaceae bacterium]